MVFKKGHVGWNKGIPCTEEFKREQSKRMSGRTPWNKGIPCTEEFKKEHSKRMMGKGNPMYGVKRTFTKEWIDKIRKSNTGRKRTQDTKDKISCSHMGMRPTYETRLKLSKAKKGKKLSEEHKLKIGQSCKGKCAGANHYNYGKPAWNRGISRPQEFRDKLSNLLKGYKHTNEFKLKQRMRRLGIHKPKIGTLEMPILDGLEVVLGYEILRQYSVCGYALDGYVPELNLAIEVDEMHHSSPCSKGDIVREENIKKAIGCKFLRIPVIGYFTKYN